MERGTETGADGRAGRPPGWRKGAIAAGGGLLVAALGGVFFFGALEYRLGTPSRMGPGFVPLVLGAICMAMGLATAFQGYRRADRFTPPNWRPFVFISGSVVVFALSIHTLGLLPAIALTVAVASLADPTARPGPTLALAIVIAGMCWLVFQRGLGMTMPALRLPF